MQNRNLILFLTLSMATLIAWNTFVVPRIVPHKPAAAQNAAQKDADAAKAASPSGEKKKAGTEKTASESKKSDAHAAVSAKKGDDKAVAAGDANVQGNAEAGKVPTYGRKPSSWAAAIQTPDTFCNSRRPLEGRRSPELSSTIPATANSPTQRFR